MAAVSTEVFSKWNINYGDLLVDQGKYLEAVGAYDSAFEATEIDKLKIEAMIREANVFSLYLDEKDLALKIYKKIYNKFSSRKEAEYSLYQAGMLAKDMQSDEATILFDKYMKNYKNGKFYFQVKFLNERLKKPVAETTKPKKSDLSSYQGSVSKPIATQKTVTKPKAYTPKIKPSKDITTLRVALHKKIKSITMTGDLVLDNQRYSEITCSFRNKKVSCNNRSYDSGIEITSASAAPISIKSKKFRYAGKIKILAKKSSLRVLNIVDIENYVYGVVTSESISSWHIEALKSQAVAARTYAYYQSKVRKNWDYDVVDNTGDQVYKGLNGKSKSGVRATDETRALIITYKNKPILAQYTANSGWKSASSKEIFGVKKHYLYGHEDKFSKKMPLGTWKKDISIKDMEKGLNKKGIRIGKLYDIVPVVIGPSGRVTKVKFIGSNGEKTLKTYSSLRRIVGLHDILMTIEKRGDRFYFDGGGFGHGVGYSQWGGQSMAKAGYKFDEILKFYYLDTSLDPLF